MKSFAAVVMFAVGCAVIYVANTMMPTTSPASHVLSLLGGMAVGTGIVTFMFSN